MANVLFLGCPDDYSDALPLGAEVTLAGASMAPGPARNPDLVVIGPSAAQPSVLAQRAARIYPGVDLLIAVQKCELERLGEILKITPYIPVRTVLVSSQPRESVEQALRRAVARCDARIGHRSVMASVQRALVSQSPAAAAAAAAAAGDANGGVLTPAHGLPAPQLGTQHDQLSRFFEFYTAIRGELLHELKVREPASTVPRWLLESTEKGAVPGSASVFDLGHNAVSKGDWGPFNERVRTIAQAHADSGYSFLEWLEASAWLRAQLIEKLMAREARHAEPFRDVLLGMESFLRMTLSEVERVRSRAHAAVLGKHESDAQLFAAAVESSEDAILTTSLDGTITAQNPAAERLFGYAASEAVGQNFVRLAREPEQHLLGEIVQAAATGKGTRGFETRLQHKQGSSIEVALTLSPVTRDAKAAVGLSIVVRDITAAKQREASLRQAQKMEAVGRLAGGIAHDFNNLLTVILAHASFMLDDAEDPELAREYSTIITEAAERARALTLQLLAFSRRQPVQVARVIDAAQALSKAEQLLRRTIPSNIVISVEFEAGVWPVLIDPGRFDQLSMNLALNASDAMPDGGRLTMQLHNRVLEEANGVLPAGEYVCFSVSDTGVGISEMDLSRVFEPFFTTKPEGKGTGLGLATCYSIAREAGGDIQVSSKLDQGSIFEVWLPRSAEQAACIEGNQPPRAEALRGSETILIVEDDPAVLVTTTRMLEKYGYRVLSAPDGVAALRVLATTRVALVLTDTVMPHMGGPELAGHLAISNPSLPVVFMTGYASEKAFQNGTFPPHAEVLLKPFTTEDLVSKLRAVLDRAAGST